MINEYLSIGQFCFHFDCAKYLFIGLSVLKRYLPLGSITSYLTLRKKQIELHSTGYRTWQQGFQHCYTHTNL